MSPKSTRLLFLILLAGIAACSRPPGRTETEPEPVAPEVLEYTVREGDTWARISETFFGDASRAERVARENAFPIAVDPVPETTITVTVSSEELVLVSAIAQARSAYNAGVEAMNRDGGDEEAVEAFEQALEVAPHFVDARYNLGLVLIRRGQPGEAAGHFEKVVAARPEDAEAWYALAASRFHRGDYGRSLPALDRSLELDPEFLRALWTRALCLQRMGRGEDAIAAWRAYLERDQRSAWADQAREHLADLGA